MTIIFHEGLPGSGKSYEAMKSITEQLAKGRAVTAYMEGLNFQKIADYLKKPVEYVNSLLTTIDREDVRQIYTKCANDDFIVIDEIQNFWPATRERLPDEMIQFVTEHRHLGQDILIMGQDHRDTHNLWKRRIDKKLSFLKLDALGASSRYRWTAEQQASGKWVKIGGKTEKYDSSYFGLYKSHESNTDNKDTYSDERFSVWKSPIFKIGLPVAVVLAGFAINHLAGFFSPAQASEKVTASVKPLQHLQPVNLKPVASLPVVSAQPVKIIPKTFVGKLVSNYRPRISGVIETDQKLMGYIDFLDGSFHVKERLTIESVVAMGWEVDRQPYGIIISKDDETHIVTSWPIDPFGAVSRQTRASPALTASPSVARTATAQPTPKS